MATPVRPKNSSEVESERVVHPRGTETRTKREFGPEAEINNLMRRYLQTGELPIPNTDPVYGFANADDYLAQQQKLSDFRTMFELLPSEIREQCEGRPERLLDWLDDDRNADRALQLGLMTPDEHQAVTSADHDLDDQVNKPPPPKAEGSEAPVKPAAQPPRLPADPADPDPPDVA